MPSIDASPPSTRTVRINSSGRFNFGRAFSASFFSCFFSFRLEPFFLGLAWPAFSTIIVRQLHHSIVAMKKKTGPLQNDYFIIISLSLKKLMMILIVCRLLLSGCKKLEPFIVDTGSKHFEAHFQVIRLPW